MLKRKISNEAYAALSDELKKEYKPNGTEYVLDTDDATDLINARDGMKRERDAAAAERDQLKAKVKELETSGADWVGTETKYKGEIEQLKQENGSLNSKLTEMTKIVKCGPLADKIASKFAAPSLLKDKIMQRLDVDPKTGEPRVLDATGKASALKIEELEKEFVDNPEYKSILVGSKASGSAGMMRPGGSAPTIPTNSDGSPKLLANMSPQEIAAARAAKKEQGATS